MLKNLWAEFKAFAFKGNMIELAVAVVIGAAFGNVITAMVKDIINPSISYAVTAVKEAKKAAEHGVSAVTSSVGATGNPTTAPSTGLATTQPAVAGTPTPPVAEVKKDTPPAEPAKPDDAGKAVDLDWKIGRFPIGDFIGAVINFIIVAFAVFILIVKLMGSVMKKVGGSTPAPSEPTTRECPECLSIIPLKARRCPNCTSVLVAGTVAT